MDGRRDAPAKQQIRFCSSHDGARIAYATSGRGPPFVKVANWLSHLEYDWESPVWRPLLAELSRRYTLVRYDERGCGLSDWNVDDLSFESWVHDLETVVAAAGVERFPLLGLSQGASIAVAYAVRHPERVSHLILHGGYARGRLRRNASPEQREEAEMMNKLAELGWGQANPAFRQFFTTQFIPDGTPAQHHWFNELERISTSPRNAGRFMREFNEIDVVDLLPRVSCPTLVFHTSRDVRVPFDEGRLIASLIPGARFVPLESNNHLLLDSEPGWRRWLDELDAFLPAAGDGQGAFADLTPRERTLLELIAQGRDNAQIAAALSLSEKTVRNHITSIFAKLEVDNRARAVVVAREAGFGRRSRTT
jgi:pimeloyl-ACP methyl ester carboxylesterase/DNA-binding CsgD family transcriptional regulator